MEVPDAVPAVPPQLEVVTMGRISVDLYPREATRWAKEAVRLATVVVGNQSEVEMAVGTREAEAAAEALLALGSSWPS